MPEYLGGSKMWIIVRGPSLGFVFSVPDPDEHGWLEMWIKRLGTTREDIEECVGGVLSKDIYKELYEMIGTTFGAGDEKIAAAFRAIGHEPPGPSVFQLPDFRGRVVLGDG